MTLTLSLKAAVRLSNKNGITEEKTLSWVDFCMRRKEIILFEKMNDGGRERERSEEESKNEIKASCQGGKRR